MTRKQLLFWSLFFLFCFLIWTGLYLTGILEPIDKGVRLFFENLGTPFLYQIATTFSFLASSQFLVPLTVLLLFVFKKRKARIYLVLNLFLSTLLAHTIKILLQRPRAVPFFGPFPKDYSYPSGHTMAAICFYGFLFVFLKKRLSKASHRAFMKLCLIPLFILIPLSRLILGVHYFSDIIASFFLAMFFLFLLFFLIRDIGQIVEEVEV